MKEWMSTFTNSVAIENFFLLHHFLWLDKQIVPPQIDSSDELSVVLSGPVRLLACLYVFFYFLVTVYCIQNIEHSTFWAHSTCDTHTHPYTVHQRLDRAHIVSPEQEGGREETGSGWSKRNQDKSSESDWGVSGLKWFGAPTGRILEITQQSAKQQRGPPVDPDPNSQTLYKKTETDLRSVWKRRFSRQLTVMIKHCHLVAMIDDAINHANY